MKTLIRYTCLCLLIMAAIGLIEAETESKALIPDNDNDWNFTISPNVQDGIYHDGDFLTLWLYSERDCFFRITHIDVNGEIQVIYPVNSKDDNFIRAGNIRLIPDNTFFKLGPPYGEEVIVAAAYDRAFAFNQPSGTAPLGQEIVSGNFTVESDDHEILIPLITAKFSFTIKPR